MSNQTGATKKDTPKKQTRTSTDTKSAESLNISEIRELAELVDQHGFTDFEFENEKIKIRLSKQSTPQIVQTVAAPIAPPSVQVAPAVAPVAKSETRSETPHPGAKSETEAAADEDLFKITSPIVGTFYSSPSPDKEPYIKVGSRVSPDTTVCIVEAMKLMNELQAETSGEVVKIYVENGQPVEYGQPLFGIKQ